MHNIVRISGKSLFDLPFALSMGPQRCGTESLWPYFRARRDVALPYDVRETFFFDRNFQRGPEFYISHFRIKSRHSLVMELTTTIFDNPDAPGRVLDLCGRDIRLLCPLRNPMDRSWSAYADLLRYGLVKGSIREASEEVPQILYASRYAENLERWFEKFGSGPIHVVFTEDLEQNRAVFLKDLCGFLTLPFKDPYIKKKLVNLRGVFTRSRKALPRPKPQDIEWLKDVLSEEIIKFQKLTGISIPSTKILK
ncbi:MAG: hypothetical protein IT558_02330 [Alphaproteobacteria bacterium]|nr:hypothetical protein [Alphaproteobacteria bacterium]